METKFKGNKMPFQDLNKTSDSAKILVISRTISEVKTYLAAQFTVQTEQRDRVRSN